MNVGNIKLPFVCIHVPRNPIVSTLDFNGPGLQSVNILGRSNFCDCLNCQVDSFPETQLIRLFPNRRGPEQFCLGKGALMCAKNAGSGLFPC